MEEAKYQPTVADAMGLASLLADDITKLVERVAALEEEVAELRSKAGRIGWSNE